MKEKKKRRKEIRKKSLTYLGLALESVGFNRLLNLHL